MELRMLGTENLKLCLIAQKLGIEQLEFAVYFVDTFKRVFFYVI
jgi:hypothetical protein